MKLLVMIAVGLLAAPLSAQTPAAPQILGTRLDISATGESHRTPDIATISAGVVSLAPTAARALGDNAARMAATIAALRKAGVEPRDIQTQSIRLAPQYRYDNGQPPALTGYQASNNVSVRFRDVRTAGPILDGLVAAGANQIDGPNFSVDHPDAALDEARVDAITKARARAALYAKAAGLHVGRIVHIAESSDGAPVMRPMMMRAKGAAPAATELAAGEETLAVTLQVTFELQ
jgi:uncharacterized protein YggE